MDPHQALQRSVGVVPAIKRHHHNRRVHRVLALCGRPADAGPLFVPGDKHRRGQRIPRRARGLCDLKETAEIGCPGAHHGWGRWLLGQGSLAPYRVFPPTVAQPLPCCWVHRLSGRSLGYVDDFKRVLEGEIRVLLLLHTM